MLCIFLRYVAVFVLQLLWEYKSNLTMSTMFDKAAFEVCESFMSEVCLYPLCSAEIV